MNAYTELKEMLCAELDEIAKKGELSAGDLEMVDKLTHSIKSIETIMAMGGYSGDGYSYARNRKRDSMGRYSRDSGRYYPVYSRDESKAHMLDELEDMMDRATTDREREAIHKCIRQLG